MRKAILPVLGIAAAAAVLAACSSSSKSDGNGSTTPVVPPGTGQQQTTTAASDTTPASNGACQPDVVVQFCETIDISGAVTISGTAVATPQFDQDSVDATCASWVNHQPENTDYPQFATPSDAVGGHKLQAHWKLPYKVGTYKFGATTAATDPNFGYALSSNLQVDSKPYNVTTFGGAKSAATGSYEIKADGSGTLTFDKLLGGDGASDTISGSISWTCVDPQS